MEGVLHVLHFTMYLCQSLSLVQTGWLFCPNFPPINLHCMHGQQCMFKSKNNPKKYPFYPTQKKTKKQEGRKVILCFREGFIFTKVRY